MNEIGTVSFEDEKNITKQKKRGFLSLLGNCSPSVVVALSSPTVCWGSCWNVNV